MAGSLFIQQEPCSEHTTPMHAANTAKLLRNLLFGGVCSGTVTRSLLSKVRYRLECCIAGQLCSVSPFKQGSSNP